MFPAEMAICPRLLDWIYCLTVLLMTASLTGSLVFPLEGESASTTNSSSVRKRPGASAQHTIHLTSGSNLILTFCLRRRSYVSVSNVVYSNDGPSDRVVIWMDHTVIGGFSSKSHSDYGEKWKKMISTGALGKPFPLPSGEHSLVLKIQHADRFGIEIDKLDLFVSDASLTVWDVRCIIHCLENSLVNNAPGRDDVLPAKIEQRSRSTSCAEEDNVKIPVYHRSARRYRLTASLPEYESLTRLNNRGADFSGCDAPPSAIWQLGEDDGLSDEFRTYTPLDGGRVFEASGDCRDFPGVINLGSAEEISLDITFEVEGPSRGSVRSEVGSVLTLNLTDMQPGEDFDVGIQYRGRQEEFSTPEFRTFSGRHTLHTWDIPDFTWSESSQNSLRLFLKNTNKGLANKEARVSIDFIRLRKRRENGEKVFTIYTSKDLVIEGIEVDFWWLSPHTMRLRRTDTGQVWPKVDFFRVYVRLPYSDSMAQNFVMYQDGNVRLLPLPPKGLDWIPFGSSVIVGHSNASAYRPHADVALVDLNPEKLEMKLTYLDGSHAILRLYNKIYQTVLEIEQAEYTRNPDVFPFVMLRSMWVDDGNSDVEKVTSAGDAKLTRHILGNWKPFYATSVIFHRSCVSRHNTLSPDIRLDMLP